MSGRPSISERLCIARSGIKDQLEDSMHLAALVHSMHVNHRCLCKYSQFGVRLNLINLIQVPHACPAPPSHLIISALERSPNGLQHFENSDQNHVIKLGKDTHTTRGS